ncbi:MAG: hypothetical protein K9N09_06035 [Candidatus Cloacimonetes bacterium]|nr:hypothetical protein [Candidatus Cloacimonadota bacterium]MCF7814681.1 hypothetical protein [Candidatus Cloacimonadota bacterium]MCF7868243.1 hypothetical protein [Candidatus Cloacimonadota bacterium]MCF7883676.1 hypothetical protein [Candidatus Cloacimonadota bacterium]
MKKLVLIFVIGIFLSNLFGWGGLAHRIITEQAMQNLPQEIPVSMEWKVYIVEHCSDPDKRKDDTPGEEERHYIDIDYYEEFNRGEMIFDKEKLIEKYSEEVVVDLGILPWAILETYKNLVKAFEEQNNEEILLYASDLAHYVEDGSQPQHLILNYNGKMTDQYGIHRRYETGMIETYESEIRANLKNSSAEKIDVDLDYIFNYITDSNSLAPIIFDADLHALKYAEDYNDEYYRLLWFKTKYITQLQFNYAAEYLASFIYSAWMEAGKP